MLLPPWFREICKPHRISGMDHHVIPDIDAHMRDTLHIGFADLKSAQWAKKIYAFGRLPIE